MRLPLPSRGVERFETFGALGEWLPAGRAEARGQFREHRCGPAAEYRESVWCFHREFRNYPDGIPAPACVPPLAPERSVRLLRNPIPRLRNLEQGAILPPMGVTWIAPRRSVPATQATPDGLSGSARWFPRVTVRVSVAAAAVRVPRWKRHSGQSVAQKNAICVCAPDPPVAWRG